MHQSTQRNAAIQINVPFVWLSELEIAPMGDSTVFGWTRPQLIMAQVFAYISATTLARALDSCINKLSVMRQYKLMCHLLVWMNLKLFLWEFVHNLGG